MASYRIYLTKSAEAAARIAHSFEGEDKTEDVGSVSHGKLCGEDCVPKIYHGKGYFCCIVELSECGEDDAPTYELTIC